VITTSSLHDPITNSIAPPEHVDAEKLARGQGSVGAGASAKLAINLPLIVFWHSFGEALRIGIREAGAGSFSAR
jgi:hypothetical protein